MAPRREITKLPADLLATTLATIFSWRSRRSTFLRIAWPQYLFWTIVLANVSAIAIALRPSILLDFARLPRPWQLLVFLPLLLGVVLLDCESWAAARSKVAFEANPHLRRWGLPMAVGLIAATVVVSAYAALIFDEWLRMHM